jgi:anti-anti-sigma factor
VSAPTPLSDCLRLRFADQAGLRIGQVCGAAGAEQAEELQQNLAAWAAAAPRLILDLSELTFINSAGLGALIVAYRTCRGLGGALHLVGPRECVADVLRITHLDRLIPTFPTLADASAAFGPAPP